MAETINGLYKTELIHRRAPWKTREAVELATLEWVSWFNNHRTSRRQKPRQTTIAASWIRPSPPDSRQLASKKAGAIHDVISGNVERYSYTEEAPLANALSSCRSVVDITGGR